MLRNIWKLSFQLIKLLYCGFKSNTDNYVKLQKIECKATNNKSSILCFSCVSALGFSLSAHWKDFNVDTEGAYVTQKAAPHSERLRDAALQLVQEVVTVKVMQLFQVPEDAPPLSPEVLGDVCSLQLGEVVLSDITQGFDVLPLCGQQLL